MRKFLLLPFLLLAQHAAAQDTAMAVASHRYMHPSIPERIFIGANYRDIWAMRVPAKVFHPAQEKGGLTITGPGGGMQTQSLHLEDKTGRKWVLRSTDKSVDKALEAKGIKNRRARYLAQQMISASQPYGQLTIPPMARALRIISTGPELFFVPDDSVFGPYRPLLANTLCLLEQREPVLYEGDEVTGTEKMLQNLEASKACRLDEKMLLQARLLDMLVADWDRHEDQWKWEYHPVADGTIAIYPIPRDHDQAYFNSTGLVFRLMRTFNARMFVGFRKSMKLKALNYKAWYFDRTLLKDLTEGDWRAGIQSFRATLSDAVLEEGLKQLPPPVYAAHGRDFLTILSVRRERMLREGMKYYHFLQTHPKQVRKAGAKQKKLLEKADRLKEAAGSGQGPRE